MKPELEAALSEYRDEEELVDHRGNCPRCDGIGGDPEGALCGLCEGSGYHSPAPSSSERGEDQ